MSYTRKIGVLGGGQLGRMLVEAGNRMSININILDSENAPAKQISRHGGHVNGSFQDPSAIRELAKTCDIITVEIEHVDTEVLEEISKDVAVEPSWQTLRTIQDKFAQKERLANARIAVGPYQEVLSPSDQSLRDIASAFGYPFMLKSKRQAYDGRGNFKVRSEDDLNTALKALGEKGLYAEKWIPFKKELAVMVVKTRGEVLSYPTVQTIHEDSVCKLVYAPAVGVNVDVNKRAQKLARNAVAQFSGMGVFGVEMFLLYDDGVLINEIAPRPHNSGHYTIEGCPMSQYTAHIRALLDLPIRPESLELQQPTVMLNILGGASEDSHLELARQAADGGLASVHLYGKDKAKPGRKMGHITVKASYMYKAEKIIEPLIETSNKIRQTRQDLPGLRPFEKTGSKPRSARPVAITTGSESDQPKLEPCYQLLDELKIPYEARITSAHRTPDHMSDFAKEAECNGVQVIIGSAGGAAHLPGMLAANTSLPVIGLPIMLHGEWMDSVLSILNMPSGVPVATVAADKAANAALLAARIMARLDRDIDTSLKTWIKKAQKKSLESDQKLQMKMDATR